MKASMKLFHIQQCRRSAKISMFKCSRSQENALPSPHIEKLKNVYHAYVRKSVKNKHCKKTLEGLGPQQFQPHRLQVKPNQNSLHNLTIS